MAIGEALVVDLISLLLNCYFFPTAECFGLQSLSSLLLKISVLMDLFLLLSLAKIFLELLRPIDEEHTIVASACFSGDELAST